MTRRALAAFVVGSFVSLVSCHGRHVELLEDDAGPVCDGLCVPVFDVTCADTTLPSFGGGCTPIGVAACGTGFDNDGKGGCTPRLPTCPDAGEMAVPGGTCRKATSCDTSVDRWGGLKPGVRVFYVDASSTVPSPDGTIGKPFAKIADAVAVAGFVDDIIAVSPGSYVGDVSLGSADLWGACDGLVEIVGTSKTGSALRLPSPHVVRHVAVRGPGGGVVADEGGTFQGVWVHATGREGVSTDAGSSATLAISDSLVEDAVGAGVHFRVLTDGGSSFTLARSVVRATHTDGATATGGIGVLLASASLAPTVKATIDGSVIDDNNSAGIDVAAMSLAITGSLVRRTLPTVGVLGSGNGLRGVGGSITIRGSVFSENAGATIDAREANEVDLEGVVIRDTKPDSTTGLGSGIHLVGGHLRLTDSLVIGSYGGGLMLDGVAIDVVSSLILDTRAFGSEASVGFGIYARFDETKERASTLTMRNSAVVGSAGGGVVLTGATADIKDSAIRQTSGVTSAHLGNGLLLNARSGATSTRTLATIARTIVERSAGGGIQIFGSVVAFNASIVSGCTEGAVLVATGGESPAEFTAHDGSQCGCLGFLQDCTPQPSSLGP